MVRARPIPEATVGRLPVYLRALVEMAEDGRTTTSSEGLAEAAGVNSAKVRKDLSYLGSYGTRGVGYDVAYLIHQVRRELGLTQDWPVLIAGVGNLGHALANYRGFSERGFRVVALVDADPDRVGEVVAGVAVRHVDEMARLVRKHDVAIGMICTPAAWWPPGSDRS
jgi:redox-sensing transcriptional repressor